MSLRELRREIKSAIQDEGIEVTELIGEAIDNLIETIEEEDENRQLDVDDEEEDD